MSTLLAFFGIDDKPTGQQGHASAYLASDSWITRKRGECVEVLRQDAQKVFTSFGHAAIFGYVGDQRFEQIVQRLVAHIDRSGGIFSGTHGSIARAQQIERALSADVRSNTPLGERSLIIYIGLHFLDKQPQFHIWIFSFDIDGSPESEELNVPNQSGPPFRRHSDGAPEDVLAFGTGANLLFARDVPTMGDWHRQENLVCAYYRALRAALSVKHDPRSGGVLQIATLYRNGRASYVGVVENGTCYVAGRKCNPNGADISRLVDQDFDEVDRISFATRADRKPNPPLLPKSINR